MITILFLILIFEFFKISPFSWAVSFPFNGNSYAAVISVGEKGSIEKNTETLPSRICCRSIICRFF